MDLQNGKTVFSGVQPSGAITIGNYLGAIKNWASLQEQCRGIFFIADMHAITVRPSPQELRARILSTYAQLVACGIDPEKSVLFIQSHVAAHAELTWILNCSAMLGELTRMTQFKDKSKKNTDNINAGLLTYPVLQAADILLYQAELVPVGADQKQHIELTRNIALRFNAFYGETFTVPEPYIPKAGAKIMSLCDPAKKMSKSDDNENGYIAILDSPDTIRRKLKRAVTDSEACVQHRAGKDGVNNLITIYSCFTGQSIAQIEAQFDGMGYGQFKPAVAEAVIEALRPIQEKTDYLLKNKDYLESLYAKGAEKAAKIAHRTLDKAYKRVGFIKKPPIGGGIKV